VVLAGTFVQPILKPYRKRCLATFAPHEFPEERRKNNNKKRTKDKEPEPDAGR
jgi:hypothetical protein